MGRDSRIGLSKREIYNVATRPELSKLDPGMMALHWTNHALMRAGQKEVEVRSSVNGSGRVIEAEVDSKTGKLLKLLIRIRVSGWIRDEVLALRPLDGRGKQWLVLTCWTNLRSDNHETLDLRKIAS